MRQLFLSGILLSKPPAERRLQLELVAFHLDDSM